MNSALLAVQKGDKKREEWSFGFVQKSPLWHWLCVKWPETRSKFLTIARVPNLNIVYIFAQRFLRLIWRVGILPSGWLVRQLASPKLQTQKKKESWSTNGEHRPTNNFYLSIMIPEICLMALRLSACLCVCLTVCLSVCLSVCVYPSVCLFKTSLLSSVHLVI